MSIFDPLSQVKPYKVGKSLKEIQKKYNPAQIYRLASNEIPAYRNEVALEALKKTGPEMHLYPNPRGSELVKAIARKFNFNFENVVLGAGASELIEHVITLLCNPLDPSCLVMFPQETFIGYKVSTQVRRVSFFEVPLREDLSVNMDIFCKSIREKKPRVCFLANPNNPTGLLINKRDWEQLLKVVAEASDTLFVIDEAYREFVRDEDTYLGFDLFREYKNIAVLRTFSKAYGLAGARIGYMVAPSHIVEGVLKIRSPFSVSRISQFLALEVFQKDEFMKQTCQKIHEQIDYLYGEFDRIGLKYYKTQGNFIFLEPKKQMDLFYEELLKEGLILRTFLDNSRQIRLTVGEPHENQKVCEVIERLER